MKRPSFSLRSGWCPGLGLIVEVKPGNTGQIDRFDLAAGDRPEGFTFLEGMKPSRSFLVLRRNLAYP